MVRLSMPETRNRRGVPLLARRPPDGIPAAYSIIPAPASSRPMRTRRGRNRRPMPKPETTLQQLRRRRAARTGPVARPARPEMRAPRYVAPMPEQRTSERTIPRRIVQSWVNRNLTPGIVKLCRSHRDLNPGYAYVFYDDQECRQFLEDNFDPLILMAYDAIMPGAFKADLFRYCELYLNGGWWLDIDTLSVAAIDVVVPRDTTFACPRDVSRSAGGLYQAVLGCEPRAAPLATAIRAIVRKTAARSSGSMLGFSGPLLLGECVRGSGAIGKVLEGSSKETGELRLGGQVLAVGHARLRQTPVQRMIEDAYRALRQRAGARDDAWNTPVRMNSPIQNVAHGELDRLKRRLVRGTLPTAPA